MKCQPLRGEVGPGPVEAVSHANCKAFHVRSKAGDHAKVVRCWSTYLPSTASIGGISAKQTKRGSPRDTVDLSVGYPGFWGRGRIRSVMKLPTHRPGDLEIDSAQVLPNEIERPTQATWPVPRPAFAEREKENRRTGRGRVSRRVCWK
ncbi:unnamed protein product [Aspergillus oryzae]|nr:unnamed protein product [Aspergillus oryzae]GMF92216.1 unnamed protein product [Aspergillus oryzae]